MNLSFTHAEQSAIMLAAIMSGHADAESFARAIILRFVNNYIDSARDRTDNVLSMPPSDSPSPSPLRLFRGK